MPDTLPESSTQTGTPSPLPEKGAEKAKTTPIISREVVIADAAFWDRITWRFENLLINRNATADDIIAEFRAFRDGCDAHTQRKWVQTETA